MHQLKLAAPMKENFFASGELVVCALGNTNKSDALTNVVNIKPPALVLKSKTRIGFRFVQ